MSEIQIILEVGFWLQIVGVEFAFDWIFCDFSQNQINSEQFLKINMKVQSSKELLLLLFRFLDKRSDSFAQDL